MLLSLILGLVPLRFTVLWRPGEDQCQVIGWQIFVDVVDRLGRRRFDRRGQGADFLREALGEEVDSSTKSSACIPARYRGLEAMRISRCGAARPAYDSWHEHKAVILQLKCGMASTTWHGSAENTGAAAPQSRSG